MKCFICTKSIPQAALYCPTCGVLLHRRCEGCGNIYTVGYDAYCRQCGRPHLVGMCQNKSLLNNHERDWDGLSEAMPCSGMSDPESALWASLSAPPPSAGTFNGSIPGLAGCIIRHGRIFAVDVLGALYSLDAETGVPTAGWHVSRINDSEVRVQAVSDANVLILSRRSLSIVDIATGDVVEKRPRAVAAWGRASLTLADTTSPGSTDTFQLYSLGGDAVPISISSADRPIHQDSTVLALDEGFVILARSGRLCLVPHEIQEPVPLTADNEKVICIAAGARYVAALVQKPSDTRVHAELRVWPRGHLASPPVIGRLEVPPTLPWIGLFQDKVIWIDAERQIHLARAESPDRSLCSAPYARTGEIIESPALIPFAGAATIIRRYTTNMAQNYSVFRISEEAITPGARVPGAAPGVNENTSLHFCGRYLYLCNKTTRQIARCLPVMEGS